MTTAIKKTSEYARLCEDLKILIEKGRQRAIQAVNKIFVETNWQIGKRLDQVEQIQDRASSAAFVRSLASDINVDSSTIYRALQFYRTWPEGLPFVSSWISRFANRSSLIARRRSARDQFSWATFFM